MTAVTIGMPVYNGEEYLASAIASVLSQTHDDLRLVIRDNASTDGTAAICAAIDDPRVTVLRAEVNEGAAANYNAVFAACDTPYFKWAAHDDLLASDYLERCVAALDAAPAAVGVYGRTELIDGDGTVTGTYDEGIDLSSPSVLRRATSFLRGVRLCNPVLGVIRADALRATPLIEAYAASDMTLLYRLIARGPLLRVDEASFYRRIHESMSLKANTSSRDVAAWFTTKRAGSHRLPRFRLVLRLTAVGLTAPVSAPTRFGLAALVWGVWAPRGDQGDVPPLAPSLGRTMSEVPPGESLDRRDVAAGEPVELRCDPVEAGRPIAAHARPRPLPDADVLRHRESGDALHRAHRDLRRRRVQASR